MRQIGTIPKANNPQKLADYLLTLKVVIRVEELPDAWAIWVHNEDHVPRARQELEAFARAPNAPRYLEAERAAEDLRRQELRKQREFRKNYVEVRGRWNRPIYQQCPLTFLLIAFSVLVAFQSQFGEKWDPLVRQLTIASWTRAENLTGRPTLAEVRQGEIWRLLTPMFLHFSFFHLFFNMWCLYDWGRLLELREGTWRLGVLVAVTAAASNLAQFFWSGPNFGGMSGVVFGLLGYVWMKSRYDPSAGLFLHPNTVALMLAWLVLCMTPVVDVFHIGKVANAAHWVGLGAGMLCGVASAAWRQQARR